MHEALNQPSKEPQLKSMSAIYVNSSYSICTIAGLDYIRSHQQSAPEESSYSQQRRKRDQDMRLLPVYDLANPQVRSRVFNAFLKIKTNKDCLKWAQQFGFPDGNAFEFHVHWDEEAVISIDAFLQAVASTNWLKKFICALKEAEQSGDVTKLWSWLDYREDLGDCQRVILRPQDNEIPYFVDVARRLQTGKNGYCDFIGIDELCVMSEDKFFKFPFSDAFIEDARRFQRGSTFGSQSARISPTREGFKWLINDRQLINIAKEYLKNVFDQLLTEVRPTFSLQPGLSNSLALVPTYQLESPWQSVCLSLYEFAAETSTFRKCRKPNCYNIGDWPKHKYYCSDTCRKYSERHGLKIRTNKSSK